MASHRKPAANLTSLPGRASAESLRMEEEQPVKDKTGSDAGPRAGRTGTGAKAERPADSRAHKIEENKQAEPTRDRGKPPSPAARKTRDSDLPSPARDSTG